MTYSIKDIRRANKEAGGHFFDPDTMRTWHSLILPEVYEGKGGVFFVTSERDEGALSRRFTVRQFHPETARVTTPQVSGDVGGELTPYRHHASAEEAQEVARRLARSPGLVAEGTSCPKCGDRLRACRTGEPDVHCERCGDVLPISEET